MNFRLPGKKVLIPDTPDVSPPPPSAPTRDDPAVVKARKEARDAANRRKGRRATLITGGQGAPRGGVGGTPLAGGGPGGTPLGQ